MPLSGYNFLWSLLTFHIIGKERKKTKNENENIMSIYNLKRPEKWLLLN